MSVAPPIAPLGGPAQLHFLLQIGLLLSAAFLLGRLATALSLPAIVGELFTGILLGPSLLGHLAPGLFAALFPQRPEQVHLLDSFGQVGAILLVGLTGLQLDLNLVRRRGRVAAQVSLPGFVIPLGLGVAAGLLLPASLLPATHDRWVFAVFLGVAMCVSAIPVIAKTLLDMKLLHRDVGQLILMSGTVDDILGWLGLSVLTGMATTGLRVGGLVRTIVLLVLFGCVAVLLGRPLVAVAVRRAMRSAERGPALAVVVVVVLLFSVASQALGLEAVFGALVAGMVVRAAAPEVRARLAPAFAFVTAVMAPVFFAVVGLRMDLTVLAEPTVLAAAVVLLALAVVGKFVGASLGSWVSGLNRWETLAVGAGMNARGVVGVIVAAVGLSLGVVTPAMYTIIVLIAIVTSLMGPPILRFASKRIELTADERLRLAEYEMHLQTEPRPTTDGAH